MAWRVGPGNPSCRLITLSGFKKKGISKVMALLQSFHSAPHAIVQSALAFALENQGTAESLANLADIYQQVSAMLETMPHPRAGSSGAPAIVQTANSGAASAKSSTGSPQGTTSIVSPECLDVMLSVPEDRSTLTVTSVCARVSCAGIQRSERIPNGAMIPRICLRRFGSCLILMRATNFHLLTF